MRPSRPHLRDTAANLRRRIAVEAARLIAEQGMRDYHAAKLKAAARFGPPESLPLPRNTEIEAALREHQRLFQADTQPRQLARLREAAVEAMRFLSRYEPRLVGAVLDGTADEYSAVCLHLFTDNADELRDFLRTHGIPFDEQQRQLRTDATSVGDFPALLFMAGGTAIDITLFPLDGLRQAPLDRVFERPMRRAGIDAVLQLQREQDLA